MAMTKTQVYLPEDELRSLHKITRRRKQPVAALVREAVRRTWLTPEPAGPMGIFDGVVRGTSTDHDSAFDEP